MGTAVVWPQNMRCVYSYAAPGSFSIMVSVRTERLQREHRYLIQLRTDTVIATALMALRTPVNGAPHVYYPPPHTIVTYPPLAALINEESDELLSPGDPRLVAALASAPAFVDAWCADTQTYLVSLVPGVNTGRPAMHVLERATSIFHILNARGQMGLAIGWDEARAHLQWYEGETKSYSIYEELVKFSASASAVAAALAALLGLNTATVTAAQMDAADARSVCVGCPPLSQGRRPTLRWRDCVLHPVNDAAHDARSWRVLSPVPAADVRRREEPYRYTDLCAWVCTLCHDLLPALVSQPELRQHLRELHAVENAVEGTHFISFMGVERPNRRQILLSIGGEHPARYRCHRCANLAPHLVKLFSKRAVQRHVADKHLVESPGEGDWSDEALLLPESNE
ncbi:hypothetical protein C8R47DRAFT_742220 [Mycena vitilis]|nr:hypothetical protein C8R47DRAFT_742220 [Mycena vitilis]